MQVEGSTLLSIPPDVTVDGLVADREPPPTSQPACGLLRAPLLPEARLHHSPVRCTEALIAARSAASPSSVVVGQVRTIDPAPSILRVASHLATDRTSMPTQCPSNRSLLISLFS